MICRIIKQSILINAIKYMGGVIMRALFQILAIPYRRFNGIPEFCVFHRADFDQWQFIAGGGEDNESPLQAAKREISE
jgi:dATP pyrophosphohydrolase